MASEAAAGLCRAALMAPCSTGGGDRARGQVCGDAMHRGRRAGMRASLAVLQTTVGRTKPLNRLLEAVQTPPPASGARAPTPGAHTVLQRAQYVLQRAQYCPCLPAAPRCQGRPSGRRQQPGGRPRSSRQPRTCRPAWAGRQEPSPRAAAATKLSAGPARYVPRLQLPAVLVAAAVAGAALQRAAVLGPQLWPGLPWRPCRAASLAASRPSGVVAPRRAGS